MKPLFCTRSRVTLYSALIASLACATGCQEHSLISQVSAASISADSTNGDWSQWRGGVLQGHRGTTSLPVTWDSQRDVLWKTELVGEGNSSPIISDDNLLVTAQVPFDEGMQLAVICLDRNTGARRWISIAGYATGPTHAKAGFASATMAATDELCYAFFGPTGLVCLEIATGDIRWRHEYLHVHHEWGVSSSPVVCGQLVVQLVEGEKGDSFLVAYDQQSGEERWRTARESSGCWTTPVLAQFSKGSPQLIVNGTGNKDGSAGWVISYDAATGRELWRFHGTSDIPVPTAIVWNDLVISASGGNGPLLAIRANGRGDVTDTHAAWHYPTGGPYVPTGVVVKDRLYLLHDGGNLVCRDPVTGSVHWRERLNGTFTASLTADGDHLYAVSEAGDVYVIRCADPFELLATNHLEERCLATPALAQDRLYIRADRHLYCIASQQLAGSGGQPESAGGIAHAASGSLSEDTLDSRD